MNRESDSEPFGMPSRVVRTLDSARLIEMYFEKCGVDVSRCFSGVSEVTLYECDATGMRFWRPASIAGDEAFYKALSDTWPNYYKEDRWEYSDARAALAGGPKRVLEVGCGRGFFLRSLEPLGHEVMGLEFNASAIANKVTKAEIRKQFVEDLAQQEAERFDAVCSFQVLEHVIDPAGFVVACAQLVRPGGLIVLSTPNYECEAHREARDAFDLPPHHVNHFTVDSYRRVADRLGLELVSTRVQLERRARWQLADVDQASTYSSLARYGVNRVLRAVAGERSELGHSLLAVLRRP